MRVRVFVPSFWTERQLFTLLISVIIEIVESYQRQYIKTIREGVNGKKTFSFGHCPNHLNPPPSPQFGQLGPLFLEVEIQDLKVSLELRILYMSHCQMLGKFEYGLPAKF